MALGVKVALVVLFGIYVQIESINAQEPFSLQCHELYAVGTWLKTNITVIDYGSYNVTADWLNITLIDKSCHDFNDTGTYVSIKVPFDKCGSTITESGDFLIQQNSADVITHFYTNNLIVREVRHVYTMKCELQRSKNISTSLGYNVTDGVTKTFVDTGIGSYDVRIAFFQTNQFTNMVTGALNVASFQPIYIGIDEMQNNGNLKFVVQRCFATPSADFTSTPAYIFYEDRCQVDHSFKIFTANGKKFTFTIKAFKFIEIKQKVFIHCELYICQDTSNLGKCSQTCPSGGGASGRKRRSVDSVESTDGNVTVSHRERRGASVGESADGPLKTIGLTTKEIRFDREVKTCKDLTCQVNSKCMELYPAICRCDEGYVMNSETKRCENERVLPVFGIYLDMPFVEAYRDPNSQLSIALAKEAADDILVKLRQQDQYQNVVGVKVIRFSPGSVVIDILLIYKKTSNPAKAFAALVAALKQPDAAPSANQKFNFKIKKGKVPTLVKGGVQPPTGEPIRENNHSTIILIAVVVPSIAVVFVALIIYKLKMGAIQRRRQDQKVIYGFDNRAVVNSDVVVVRDRKM